MKHDPRVVIILLVLFLTTQYVGLAIVNQYIDYEQSTTEVIASPLPAVIGQEIERPQIEEKSSPLFIMGAVLIGTILAFILLRFAKPIFWKVWFFLAVSLCLYFAFATVVPATIAGMIAMVCAALKTWRPSTIVHNVTEIFLYGGMVSVFFTILNIPAAVIMLLLISAYDAYAVWKSRHMIVLAKAQAKAGMFAGLLIPYGKHTLQPVKKTIAQSKTVRVAVLGGGDLGFPLLFSAAVLKDFALVGQGWLALLIPPFAAATLGLLLWYGKKDKFYPAMPFISAGCFVGLGVVFLVRMLL